MQISLKKTYLKGITYLCRVIFLIVAANMLASCTKTEDYIQAAFIKHSELIDPSSAMFRNIGTSDAPFFLLKFFNPKWCGEINYKDSRGNYKGWMYFTIIRIQDGSGADGNGEVSIYINQTSDFYHEVSCSSKNFTPSWMPIWKTL